jgi:hypothetical protein
MDFIVAFPWLIVKKIHTVVFRYARKFQAVGSLRWAVGTTNSNMDVLEAWFIGATNAL